MYFNQPSKYPRIDRAIDLADKVQSFADHNLKRLDYDLELLGVHPSKAKYYHAPYAGLFAVATVTKYSLMLIKEI